MSCDVGEATEGMENEALQRLYVRLERSAASLLYSHVNNSMNVFG